jgi:hypothetical protein
MPTHHINEMGDMMGFRFSCNAFASGNCLPVVRTMFHGHTLVECQQADEALILRLMSSPEANRERMRQFLQRVEDECVPASLDCVPENASAVTQHGTVQAQGLLTVDSQHWTPELPDRIGIYHAYIRGFNRDVRNHRLFIGCSGGMNRASDAFCNMVIDVGKSWTPQVRFFDTFFWFFAYLARPGHLRVARGVVAAQGVQAGAVPADQGPGGRLRDPGRVNPGASAACSRRCPPPQTSARTRSRGRRNWPAAARGRSRWGR